MIQHANAHEKKNKNTQWTGQAWGLHNIGSTRASTTSTKTKHGWHTLTPLGPQKHIQFCTDPLPKFVGIGHPPAHSLYLGPPKLHNLCIHRFRPFTHKSSQSKAKHAITKQNEQNSYKIIEFTTYWMKMVQIALIWYKSYDFSSKSYFSVRDWKNPLSFKIFYVFCKKKQRNFIFFMIFCQKMKKRDFRSKSGIWGGTSNAGDPYSNAGDPYSNAGDPYSNVCIWVKLGRFCSFCKKWQKLWRKIENVIRFDRFYIFHYISMIFGAGVANIAYLVYILHKCAQKLSNSSDSNENHGIALNIESFLWILSIYCQMLYDSNKNLGLLIFASISAWVTGWGPPIYPQGFTISQGAGAASTSNISDKTLQAQIPKCPRAW